MTVAASDTRTILDSYLSTYDMAITEHIVIDAEPVAVFEAAKELDFLTVRSPLLTAAFFVRGLPSRLRGHTITPPPELRLAAEGMGLPGWVVLGEIPGREIAFGAVGRFWSPDIEWRDVPVEEFSSFAEPGWGKIACHFLAQPDGPGRAVLSYECRTATTDFGSRRAMARYWWVIRPFVGHIMRATLRTIVTDVGR